MRRRHGPCSGSVPTSTCNGTSTCSCPTPSASFGRSRICEGRSPRPEPRSPRWPRLSGQAWEDVMNPRHDFPQVACARELAGSLRTVQPDPGGVANLRAIDDPDDQAGPSSPSSVVLRLTCPPLPAQSDSGDESDSLAGSPPTSGGTPPRGGPRSSGVFEDELDAPRDRSRS